MRRRNLLVIVVVAVIIALVAWAVLTSGKSTAPEERPGGSSRVGPERAVGLLVLLPPDALVPGRTRAIPGGQSAVP